MLFGRKDELEALSRTFKEPKSSLVVIYGRRRIGKSSLVHAHLANREHFHFEGIEKQNSKFHINLLTQKLIEQIPSDLLPENFNHTWSGVLDLLTILIQSKRNKKSIIFLDEYQWICSGRSQLTALLKGYWDNKWKKLNVQLILCGSISSFMVKKVIRSKALYGRIDAELNVQQLLPNEAKLFFNSNKSNIEKLKYLLVFGGVPKYLEDIKSSLSFNKNISQFFFDKYSSYINEYEKIFYSQFREHEIYEKIVRFLATGPSTLDQIASEISFPSGGGLKSYIDNLQKSQFIDSYYPSPDKLKAKRINYKLVDPFLRFYLTFVFPYRDIILKSKDGLSLMQRLTKDRLNVFFGLAFENFCQLFAISLAKKMGFEDEVLHFGPFFSKAAEPFQIDLLYFRENKSMTLCEVKFKEEGVGPSVILEVERKIEKLKNLYPDYSIDKALISTLGATKALSATGYFEYILDAKKILE